MQSSNALEKDPLIASLQEPPRVLYVLHASVFEAFGGIEYYLDDVISMTVDVFGAENVRIVAPLAGKPQVERPYAVRFAPRPKNTILRKIYNRFSPNLFALAQTEIDDFNPTLIVNSHVSLGPLVWALSQRNHIPYLTVVYGIEAWGHLKPQDEYTLKRSHGIISISRWTKQIMTKRGYDSSLFEIVSPRLPQHFDHVVPPKRETKKNRLHMITISRLDGSEAYKGHDHVLQAIAKLKNSAPHLDLHYTIQGNGSDRPRLEKLSTSLGLDSQVTFKDSVKERDELEKSYANTDCFIMASRFGRWDKRWRGEGFGIVYVEAAAFEVPSIAYNCGGATDIIVHDKTGYLVEPDHIDHLAAAIQRMAENPESRKKMGESAREHVFKTFAGPSFRKSLEHAVLRFSPHEPKV